MNVCRSIDSALDLVRYVLSIIEEVGFNSTIDISANSDNTSSDESSSTNEDDLTKTLSIEVSKKVNGDSLINVDLSNENYSIGINATVNKERIIELHSSGFKESTIDNGWELS